MATRHSFAGQSQHFNGNLGQEEGQGMMGQMRHAVENVPQQAKQVVDEYPLSTVLAVFGLGLGVGACVGMALFSSSQSSYSSSNWFPSMNSSGSSNWFPSMSSSGSSNWFPSMSSSGSSWYPSSSNSSWFNGSNSASNWTDSLMKSAKNACGY